MSAAAPVVSVVICTHNRADYLRRALDGLTRPGVSASEYEVLVIDNCSTDHTPAVVDEFVTRIPVRRIHEPKLGLNNARNTGWRIAAGTYVVYLDDDAIPDAGWVHAIIDAFARQPNAGVVGGPVRPIWEAPRPSWLSNEAAHALTIVDWPGGAHIITDIRTQWLVGANMAIPRAYIERAGGFHAGLSRHGKKLLSNDDTYLQRQVEAMGHPLVYEPAMSVSHVVPASRLTKEWFRKRYYWQGYSDSAMAQIQHDLGIGSRVRRAAASAFRLATSPRQMRALFAMPDDPEAFAQTCYAWIALGQVMGFVGSAKR